MFIKCLLSIYLTLLGIGYAKAHRKIPYCIGQLKTFFNVFIFETEREKERESAHDPGRDRER